MAKDRPELAAKGALFKELPRNRATVSVGSTKGLASLQAYQGRWVWLRAISADITLLRGDVAMTNGQGFVLGTADGHVDFYVDPDGVLDLSHICGSSATLEILY